LWLVYAACRYIKVTGDSKILDEKAPYLVSEKSEHQGENYYSPKSTEEKYSLLKHCQEAIGRTAYLLGERGLPLILAGDWNDGMDMVGHEKKGESVWMGMFFIKILDDFLDIAEDYLSNDEITRYKELTQKVRESIEKYCWDGEWYLRAFWDNGKKLGSKRNEECKIDSITQSWAVISGLNRERQKKALSSAEEILIDRKNKIAKLFTPPFVNTTDDPGYILLYPSGVRENGGSYNHATSWLAKAAAMIGNGDLAMEIVDMINPFKRTITDSQVEKYRGEPYVVAADISGEEPYTGMAGWTWYTGTASVLYGVILEDIIGIKKRGGTIFLNPSVPKSWSSFKTRLKLQNKNITINFKKSNSKDGKILIVNGTKLKETGFGFDKISGKDLIEFYY